MLKWVTAKQFQEYLLWKPFFVRTDTNPLTYIVTTPNLNATKYQWLESLPRLTFSIEYQKECDNVATDALSQVTLKLNAETMNPSWMGSLWELPKEQMLRTWQWPKLMKKYTISPENSNSCSSCMHRPTCDWLGDHPTGGTNTQDHDWVDFWPESTGSKTPAGRWCKYWIG